MATYINQGQSGLNCMSFALKLNVFVHPMEWPKYFAVCGVEEAALATHVGWFTERSADAAASSLATPNVDLSLEHIARIVRRLGELADWEVEQKIATHGGRYRTTVEEVSGGFHASPHDAGCRRYGSTLIRYPGTPIPLRRIDSPLPG